MSIVEELEGVKAQLRKAKIELSTKLADLNATIVNLQGALEATGGVDVNVVAALKEVKAAAQEIDDLVPDPDVPAEPAEEPVVDDLPLEEVVAEEPAAEEVPAEVVESVEPDPIPAEDVVAVEGSEQPTE